MKPTETGSFRIDDEHMKRKKDEDMKKKKEQEKVKKRKLTKRRAILIWNEFGPVIVALCWVMLSTVSYFILRNFTSRESSLTISFLGPIIVSIICGTLFFFVTEFLLPAFINVKYRWDD